MISKKKQIDVKHDLKVELETSIFDVRIFKINEEVATIEYKLEGKNGDINGEEIFEIEYDSDANLLKICEQELSGITKISDALISIGLPSLKELRIENENGPVEIKDLSGKFKVENENGVLDFINCQGSLNLENENGFIRIKSFDGDLEISTENGSIDIFSGSGTIKAGSENGQIRVLKANHHQAEIKSGNGSIFYHLPKIDKGDYSLKNENGKIHLIIPQDLSFNLTAKNENGRFHIGLAENYETDRDNGYRIIKMVRGVGKVDIKVENSNGSIDLVDDKKGHFNFKFHKFGNRHGFEAHMPDIPDMSECFSEMGDFMGKKMHHKFHKIFKHMRTPNTEDKDFDPDLEKECNLGFEEENDEKVINKNSEYHELEERVLKMVENGTITAEEAERLLNTMKEES